MKTSKNKKKKNGIHEDDNSDNLGERRSRKYEGYVMLTYQKNCN